jgi:hypothetical protein
MEDLSADVCAFDCQVRKISVTVADSMTYNWTDTIAFSEKPDDEWRYRFGLHLCQLRPLYVYVRPVTITDVLTATMLGQLPLDVRETRDG